MEDVRLGLGEQDWKQYQLIPPVVEYVRDDSFETSDAETCFFGESFDVSQLDAVTRKQEVWLLRRYQYAQFRLGLLVEAQMRRLSVARARQMVKWHRRSAEAHAALVNHETLSQLSAVELDVYGRIPETVDFVANPVFEQASAEQDFFGGDDAPTVSAWWAGQELPDKDAPAPRTRATLTREQEAALFLRYNYARYRLSLLVEAQERRVSVTRAKQMVQWSRRAQALRSDIVNANMALVLAMTKQRRVANVEFSELVAEGNATMLRCVDKFNVAMGFKFSSYASTAILKRYQRLAGQAATYRGHFPTEYRPELERSDYDVMKHEQQLAFSVELLRDIIKTNRANLTDRERVIIESRFPMEGQSKRTVADVASDLNLTKERIRQIQNHALGKIRGVMEREHIVA
jgi:RNA polymerase sigma factor (sigma-70 family)